MMTKFHFTPDRLRKAECPAGKRQQLYWDDDPKSLGLRVTIGGAKAYIFQFRLYGRTGRVTIGAFDAWTIADARAEARRLQVLVDSGVDPREEKADRLEAVQAARTEQDRQAITLGELWPQYLEANQGRWSASHVKDHAKVMQAPGLPRQRSSEKTKAGPLYSLAATRLVDLTPTLLEQWVERESRSRPTVTAKAFRLLRAFLHWCEEQTELSGLVDPDKLLARRVRRAVASPKANTDCLQREMLADWFKGVHQSAGLVVAVYLEGLLLTGSRREELAQLRWDDVDFRWRSLTIRDKVEGQRVIPLPPYLAHRLNALPRRNEFVFSSPTSKSGRLADVYRAHQRALEVAGLPHLTLHGLRRSFGTLAEWVECPVGIVAQIQGHKPSAIAEKHYRQRPLDLLRVWHAKIEGWMLAQAGIEQPSESASLQKLQVVESGR